MGNGTADVLTEALTALAIGRRPRWTIVRILVLILLCFLTLKYAILVRRIESISMTPTLPEGSIHVLNRLAYSLGSLPARGDIVAVRTSGETVIYVKRIIGLPGETIAIRRGTVLINGKPIDEPYVPRHRPDWNLTPRVLGPNEYYVIGDNRSMPWGNHVLGRIDAQRILAKLVW